MDGLRKELTDELDPEHCADARAELAKEAMRAAPLRGEVAAERRALDLRAAAKEAMVTADTGGERAEAERLSKQADAADEFAASLTRAAAMEEYATVSGNKNRRIRGQPGGWIDGPRAQDSTIFWQRQDTAPLPRSGWSGDGGVDVAKEAPSVKGKHSDMDAELQRLQAEPTGAEAELQYKFQQQR